MLLEKESNWGTEKGKIQCKRKTAIQVTEVMPKTVSKISEANRAVQKGPLNTLKQNKNKNKAERLRPQY